MRRRWLFILNDYYFQFFYSCTFKHYRILAYCAHCLYNMDFNYFFPSICCWGFFFSLLSLTYAMVEKIMFWDQIFKLEILIELHITSSPESKNHIFSVWSVYICVCICACYQHNSKQITPETLNLILHICIIDRFYMKLFIKIEQKLCVHCIILTHPFGM